MRLHVLSDLHLEWHRDDGVTFLRELQNPGADALILAGDAVSLAPAARAETEWQLRTICRKYPHVYYLPGNHDFYGTSPREGMDRLDALASTIENLVILDVGRVSEFMGRRILGATLWFPDDPDNRRYDGTYGAAALSDFVVIREFVPWVYDQNRACRDFLQETLRQGDIVVTHHLPTFDSVHPWYARSVLNRFFVSDVKDLIVAREPALWIHGHTHQSMDYRIGPTRILCNPLGYPHEGNQGFDPRLTVELP
jgi:predicted phosphodiesterase